MEIFEQQQTLTGSLLSKFIPMQTEKIGKDGNCFFRCISKMLSGTEAHHIKLRAEVCRYIVTNGKSIIQRYLRTFRYSGCIDHTRDPQTVSLYISNLNHNHYEPVVRLMNSGYDSIKIHDPSDNP